LKTKIAYPVSAPQLGQTKPEGGGARKEKKHHVQIFLLIDTSLKGLWLQSRQWVWGAAGVCGFSPNQEPFTTLPENGGRKK
jgi:hypothetical protein